MAKPVTPGTTPQLHGRTELVDLAGQGQVMSQLAKLGYSGPVLANLIHAGMTRAQLAAALITQQRSAPHH